MIFDSISHMSLYVPVIPGLKKVKEIIDSGALEAAAPGSYKTDDPSVRYNVMSTTTKDEEPREFEIHKKEIDVQIVLRGSEKMKTLWREPVRETKSYDGEKDFSMAGGTPGLTYHARNDTFAVFFPGEPHMANMADGKVTENLKVVFKVLV
ncbi:MAG: YhcH/YjgK/YiaL family protein [Treponema sp.]|jgi:YhcH/YjgK/YiaL family protein|nr:YhcH/YjgK/YiaL family protein [Treponema sp.]